MAVDLTRALLLIVGLGPGVAVLDVRGRRGGPLEVEIALTDRPCCGGCGAKVHGLTAPARCAWRICRRSVGR